MNMDGATLAADHGLIRDKTFWLAIIVGILISFAIAHLQKGGIVAFRSVTYLQLVWMVVLFPVVEELFFRGFLQGWVRSRLAASRFTGNITFLDRLLNGVAFARLSCANIWVSLLFTTVHVVVQQNPVMTSVLVPSLVFGWFRDRYQSVVPGMLLHVFYNTFLFYSSVFYLLYFQ